MTNLDYAEPQYYRILEQQSASKNTLSFEGGRILRALLCIISMLSMLSLHVYVYGFFRVQEYRGNIEGLNAKLGNLTIMVEALARKIDMCGED